MIGDESAIKAISTYLPVVIELYTPYTNIHTNKPGCVRYAYGKQLYVHGVMSMHTLLVMGAVIDMTSMTVNLENWDHKEFPLFMRVPSTGGFGFATSNSILYCKHYD